MKNLTDKIKKNKKHQFGFTLIELIIVIGIFVTLFGISTISLTGLIPRANFVTNYQSILSDLKSQQHKAMVGDTNGAGDGSAYGIYLESNQYTLFAGPAYNPSATDNFTIQLSPGLSLTEINFPSNSIVFLQNNGEVAGFNELTSSFKLISTNTSEEKLIDLNWLGVVITN